jgi:hypothetical protein
VPVKTASGAPAKFARHGYLPARDAVEIMSDKSRIYLKLTSLSRLKSSPTLPCRT